MSKKASFTKGQWMAVGAWVEHVDDNVPDICNCDPSCMGQEGRSYEEACANARLLAAAPTMLNALWVAKYAIEADIKGAKLARDDPSDSIIADAIDTYQADLDIINDAITLATGEEA